MRGYIQLEGIDNRPTEMVESNKEYTEDDITSEIKNGCFSFVSSSLFNLESSLLLLGKA